MRYFSPFGLPSLQQALALLLLLVQHTDLLLNKSAVPLITL